jgi:four helix bundle protein
VLGSYRSTGARQRVDVVQPVLRGRDPQELAGRNALADQLDWASVSIALNIAEGAGELARTEKARFCRIARRSATECAAILDIAGELGLVPDDRLREGRQQLQTIVAMLVGLVKHIEKRGERGEPGAGWSSETKG